MLPLSRGRGGALQASYLRNAETCLAYRGAYLLHAHRRANHDAIQRAIYSREVQIEAPKQEKWERIKQLVHDHPRLERGELASIILLAFKTGFMPLTASFSNDDVEYVRVVISGIGIACKIAGDKQRDEVQQAVVFDNTSIYSDEIKALGALRRELSKRIPTTLADNLELSFMRQGTHTWELSDEMLVTDCTLSIDAPVDDVTTIIAALLTIEMPQLKDINGKPCVVKQPITFTVRAGMEEGKVEAGIDSRQLARSATLLRLQGAELTESSALVHMYANHDMADGCAKIQREMAADMVLFEFEHCATTGLTAEQATEAIKEMLSSPVCCLLDFAVRTPNRKMSELRNQLSRTGERYSRCSTSNPEQVPTTSIDTRVIHFPTVFVRSVVGNFGRITFQGPFGIGSFTVCDLTEYPDSRVRLTAEFDQHAVLLGGLSARCTLGEIRAVVLAAQAHCRQTLHGAVRTVLGPYVDTNKKAAQVVNALAAGAQTGPYLMSTEGRVVPFLSATIRELEPCILLAISKSGALSPLIDTRVAHQQHPQDNSSLTYHLPGGSIALHASSRASAGWLGIGLVYDEELQTHDCSFRVDSREYYVRFPAGSSVTGCANSSLVFPTDEKLMGSTRHPRGVLAVGISAILGLNPDMLLCSSFLLQPTQQDRISVVRHWAKAALRFQAPADMDLRGPEQHESSPAAAQKRASSIKLSELVAKVPLQELLEEEEEKKGDGEVGRGGVGYRAIGVIGRSRLSSSNGNGNMVPVDPTQSVSSFFSNKIANLGPADEDLSDYEKNWSNSGTGQRNNGSLPKLWGKKRQAVAAESSVAAKVVIVPKPEKTKELIARAIDDNLLFQDLPAPALEVIIDSMHCVEVAAGTDIIRQGDRDASQFFVLEAGVCEVWVRASNAPAPKKVLVYSAGSGFGELALLYSAPRAATVKATTRCVLWVMERTVYNAVKRNFTHEQFVARHNLLDTVPALKNLSGHQKALLVDALTQVEFKPGRHVFKRGDPGSDFYIVKEGTALVKDAAGNVLAKITVGQYFGEKALLDREPRAADVMAEGKLVCYCLSATAFQELLGSKEEIWRFERLKAVPILSALSERQLWQLAHAMHTSTFKKSDIVFRKGEQGDMFYIVQSGSFIVLDENDKELAQVREGGCFGELALLRSDVRAATVKATSDSTVLTLSRDQFTRLLGNLTQLRNIWRFEALKKVPLLSALDTTTRTSLANALRSVSLKSGGDVIRQGDIGDRFYIVERGELGVFKDRQGPIKTYGPGAYFGELALLRKEPRAATVRATTDVSLLELDRGNFHNLLGPLLPVMTKEAEAYLKQGANWKPQNKAFDVSEAQAVAVLGAGGFGQVLLVKYKGGYHALKAISKAFVKEQGLVEHVKREKDLMSECDSSFLVRLEGTATDDTTLYMMMEVVMGGELFSYLQTRTRPLDENHARFYAASVVLALEYLHDRDMVYRDLKPENLLIDLQGYIKVTDFGFVKRLRKGTKTYTLCGTPEYLAPEIIMNKGHNAAADWWALGVLVFELCNGLPPFMDDDRLAMFRKICNRELTFPKHFSNDLRHLIERLLDPNPLFRAGAGREGAAEIKGHAWFANFDWDRFQAKQLSAPYIPKQPSHAGDTCNFAPMQVDTKQFRNKAYKSKGTFKDF